MSDITKRMIDYLPRYYRESLHMNSIIDSEGSEVEALQAGIKDIIAQLFIETATWGLVLWETEFGIKKTTSDTYETRRSRLKALVRSAVTLTPERLKEIVLAYCQECDIQYSDSTYSFTVTILKPLGVPELGDNLKAAVEELRPAHLGFTIIYSYNTWQVYTGDTWNAHSGKTWYQLATTPVV